MDVRVVECPQERREDSRRSINEIAPSYVFVHTCV